METLRKGKLLRLHSKEKYPQGGWALISVGSDWVHVHLTCPICGERGQIVCLTQPEHGLDHKIDSYGVVSPSVGCPNDRCVFHDNVILEGWDKAEADRLVEVSQRKPELLNKGEIHFPEEIKERYGDDLLYALNRRPIAEGGDK